MLQMPRLQLLPFPLLLVIKGKPTGGAGTSYRPPSIPPQTHTHTHTLIQIRVKFKIPAPTLHTSWLISDMISEEF